MNMNFLRDKEMKKRKAKDDALIAMIQAGGNPSLRDLVYCFFHWSPIKWYTTFFRWLKSRGR